MKFIHLLENLRKDFPEPSENRYHRLTLNEEGLPEVHIAKTEGDFTVTFEQEDLEKSLSELYDETLRALERDFEQDVTDNI